MGILGLLPVESPPLSEVKMTTVFLSCPVSFKVLRMLARVGINRATPEVSLALNEITIAEALKEANYRTAHMGKWHLQGHGAKGKSHYPQAQGFDLNIGGHTAGQPATFFYPYKAKAAKYAKNNVPDLEGGKPGEYLTDRLTDEAITFIKAKPDQPFLLNLGTTPSTPPCGPSLRKSKNTRPKPKPWD